MSDPVQGNSMTMEEMEAADAADKTAAAATPSVAEKEAQEKIQRLENAVRLSEDARIRAVAESAAKAVAPPPAPVAAPVPEGPKDLSAEELEAMVQENPTKALQMAMEQTRRVTTRDLEARIGPLVNAGYSTAETMARTKHAADFAILGPEIDAFLATIPEVQKRAALGNSEGWDTMLNYVRGQHVDKLVGARVKTEIAAQLAAARGEQVSSAPSNIASPGAVAPPVAVNGGVVFDATTVEIMKQVLNCEDTPKARAEWVKWSNASAGRA